MSLLFLFSSISIALDVDDDSLGINRPQIPPPRSSMALKLLALCARFGSFGLEKGKEFRHEVYVGKTRKLLLK